MELHMSFYLSLHQAERFRSHASVRRLLTAIAIALVAMAIALNSANAARTILVADGFSDPLFVTSPPGDYDRIFIVEKTGTIRIIKNGTLLGTPFLDISSMVSGSTEQGLLGLAFHPNYASNGYFYINYTNTLGDTRIARYTVSANPDIANAASETILLAVDQPFSNHNAGMLEFGPNDGYLYFGLGDGGAAGDPNNNAQNGGVYFGKMLRIDVDGGSPYAIPSDNPFVTDGTILDEIWALGLRNPWRFSFDRETGNLWIGDVGQSKWEEVDFQDASSSGGENYGWRLVEGDSCYNPPTGCDPGGLTYPIYTYGHTPECSITGGFVYRGCAIPDLQGNYFFADYCSAKIWSFKYGGANITDFQDRTTELAPGGGRSIDAISSFGEDAYGELYITDIGDGEVYKIVPDDTIGVDCNENGIHDYCDIASGFSADANQNLIPDECEGGYICGDADASLAVDIDDVVYLIAYIFAAGPAPNPLASGDADCSGAIDIDDVVYLIAYIFASGPAPCDPDGNGTPNC
jgi:glucose/arabinose dehydrogenase